MVKSFIYKIWFSIEPIRTSNGIMEMQHGSEYEIEEVGCRNTGDRLFRIIGKFGGDGMD